MSDERPLAGPSWAASSPLARAHDAVLVDPLNDDEAVPEEAVESLREDVQRARAMHAHATSLQASLRTLGLGEIGSLTPWVTLLAWQAIAMGVEARSTVWAGGHEVPLPSSGRFGSVQARGAELANALERANEEAHNTTLFTAPNAEVLADLDAVLSELHAALQEVTAAASRDVLAAGTEAFRALPVHGEVLTALRDKRQSIGALQRRSDDLSPLEWRTLEDLEDELQEILTSDGPDGFGQAMDALGDRLLFPDDLTDDEVKQGAFTLVEGADALAELGKRLQADLRDDDAMGNLLWVGFLAGYQAPALVLPLLGQVMVRWGDLSAPDDQPEGLLAKLRAWWSP